MNISILVDYDNLLPNQKAAGLTDLATRVLSLLPSSNAQPRISCEMRLYGGWYEGAAMTKLAQDLSIDIQKEFPAIVRVPSQIRGINLVTVNASLAVALNEDPGSLMFNTFRRKGKPNNLRVQSPADVGCTSVSCMLPSLKKVLRNGACPIADCPCAAKDLLYRNEQKLVDTMLTCDLLFLQRQAIDCIALVSGDEDFIPPLRTLLLRSAPIYLVHPKARAANLNISAGANRLHELELQQ